MRFTPRISFSLEHAVEFTHVRRARQRHGQHLINFRLPSSVHCTRTRTHSPQPSRGSVRADTHSSRAMHSFFAKL